MKQLISALMILSVLNTPALAGQSSDHTQMIAKAFDNFRYAMTVDVRADDAAGRTVALQKFQEELTALESQGVSPEEFMEYYKSTALDQETRADFERLLSTIDAKSMTAEEASAMAVQFMNSRSSQGANYNGGGKGGSNTGAIIACVLVAGVGTFLVVRHVRYFHSMNCNYGSAHSPN